MNSLVYNTKGFRATVSGSWPRGSASWAHRERTVSAPWPRGAAREQRRERTVNHNTLTVRSRCAKWSQGNLRFPDSLERDAERVGKWFF